MAVADRLLVSKPDLATPKALDALLERLRALNPGTVPVLAEHGAAPAEALLGARHFDAADRGETVRGWLDPAGWEAHAQHHHHHHDRNRHDAGIEAFCLSYDTPLDWQGIGTWLEMLTATRGESLLRVKGILDLKGQDKPVAIHGVQHVWHAPVLLSGWPEGEPRRSRIVFIVRNLPRAVVADGLAAFLGAAETA